MKTKLEFIAAWNCCCLLCSGVEDCLNVRPLDTVSEERGLSFDFVGKSSFSDGVGSYDSMFCKFIYL